MTGRNPYSGAERLLHRLAFASVAAQKGAADIEDRLLARRFADIRIDRPVFITSLPRAGTTLLLELLSGLPDFASHTYREMPFLFTPLLWDGISRPLRRPDAVRQRAHGDGMTVGYDSPEGFEEMLWRAFWPEKYRSDRILPWTADDQDAGGEFARFIGNHIRKLLALRRELQLQSKSKSKSNPKSKSKSKLQSKPKSKSQHEPAQYEPDNGPAPARYVSKNNANIARIPYIARQFPDAVILIPFRNPVDQAGSMLRQHRNFLDIHARDAFSRRYMAYTGHFDFGANLRPLDFDGWRNDAAAAADDNPQSANFWLRYWCAAFEHILARRSGNVALLDYDGCCADPITGLHRIASAVGLANPADLAEQAGRFRPATTYDAAALAMAPALRRRAEALHRQLLQNAINGPEAGSAPGFRLAPE